MRALLAYFDNDTEVDRNERVQRIARCLKDFETKPICRQK